MILKIISKILTINIDCDDHHNNKRNQQQTTTKIIMV
jgi:hypothetical protein